jgi:hypothetical protein
MNISPVTNRPFPSLSKRPWNTASHITVLRCAAMCARTKSLVFISLRTLCALVTHTNCSQTPYFQSLAHSCTKNTGIGGPHSIFCYVCSGSGEGAGLHMTKKRHDFGRDNALFSPPSGTGARPRMRAVLVHPEGGRAARFSTVADAKPLEALELRVDWAANRDRRSAGRGRATR